MTSYRRIRLGRQGVCLDQCIREGFAGLDYDSALDLTGKFPESWREFNDQFIPIYLESNPNTSRGSVRTLPELEPPQPAFYSCIPIPQPKTRLATPI